MKIKRFLTLALTIIMLSSVCLMAISCGGNEEKRADISKAAKGAYNTVVDEFGRVINEYTMMTEKMTYIMPANASATSDGPLATTTVGCKVTPDYATDKTTTWSVSWAEDAYRSSQNVSDYIQLVPDAENSNLVTVNLIQYFGEDTIILTVKTNDGGFTDTCELTCFEAVKIQLTAGGSPVAVQSSESIGVEYDNNGYIDYYLIDPAKIYNLFTGDSRYESFYQVTVENVSFSCESLGLSGYSFKYYYGTAGGVKYSELNNKDIGSNAGYYFCDFDKKINSSKVLSEFRNPMNCSLRSDSGCQLFCSSSESLLKGSWSLDGLGDVTGGVLGYDVFDTCVPLMMKITISESVYNTSDSIYVTMKLPVSAVSMENTPDTYISE